MLLGLTEHQHSQDTHTKTNKPRFFTSYQKKPQAFPTMHRGDSGSRHIQTCLHYSQVPGPSFTAKDACLFGHSASGCYSWSLHRKGTGQPVTFASTHSNPASKGYPDLQKQLPYWMDKAKVNLGRALSVIPHISSETSQTRNKRRILKDEAMLWKG